LIALVESGDRIEIDIPNRKVNLAVADDILAKRRATQEARGKHAWTPMKKRPRKVTTALRAYAAFATSAAKGAVRVVP
jgi:dihydroxy-acid dehydratase